VDLSVPSNVESLLAGAGVELAILFGSAANGRLGPDSDIDIGVLFGRDVGLDHELALGANLERAFGREVDLVRLDMASTLLRFEASRGRCLHEGREGAFADFVARALLEHEDLLPILRRCAEGMFRKLKEARDQA
jgi:uncharacterized protein